MDGSHHIGTSKEFSTAIIVVFEIVVELKRLAGLHGNYAIYAPAIRELFHAGGIGEFVNEIPSQAMANIEI